MNSPPPAGAGINLGGRGQQRQQQQGEGVLSSTSSTSDAIDFNGGAHVQWRPSSASPTTPAPHFLSMANRGRSAASAAADATNHNGNHVARLPNGACNNNAAGDSGYVEDIYAKVGTC